MKFSVSSSTLLSLLATTGKVINNKSTLPILDYFLMELHDDKLKVTASDLETTLVGVITVENLAGDGVISVPAKQILDSLKEFADVPLTFDCNDQTFEINIQWNSGNLLIPGASASSYPAIPEPEDDSRTLDFNVDVLVNGINKTVFATADDDLRPIMNGVYVRVAGDTVTFVATDAHKLVKHTSKNAVSEDAYFILPKKPATLLRAILVKEERPVQVIIDQKNARFQLADYTMVCRLIEGNYPNYDAVIPKNNPNKILVDRVELLNGVKRVAVCSNASTNLVRMDIGSGKIELTAQDVDYSMSAKDLINCNYEGQPITIGFKAMYLVEVLSNLDTPTIVAELADATRAGVFSPVNDDEQQGSQTLMLLMPMMINA
jgi:DNA polymerase-3 subunit beta